MTLKYLRCKLCDKLKQRAKVSTHFKVCYKCITNIPEYLDDEQRVRWLNLKIKDSEKNRNKKI